jgi:hypothetical protein
MSERNREKETGSLTATHNIEATEDTEILHGEKNAS